MREDVSFDAPRIRDDDHLPPILGIDLAPHQARPFETIDQAGNRAGGEAGELREPSGGSGPMEEQKVCCSVT